MAQNQMNKLVWIVNTISKAGKISFEGINRKWRENEFLSGGQEMIKRTFYKWRDSIFDTFGLIIECEQGGLYRYYIRNSSELRNGSLENCLLRTYSISNSLIESKSIKDKIVLEDIPSGVNFLAPIIDAMKTGAMIHITYFNYRRGDTLKHYVMPLCVKLFHQRWYVVGRSWPSGYTSVFCLDRIVDFRLSSHKFVYPEDFDAEEFFQGCFGVIADTTIPVEHVVLKATADQSSYLRDLPMHATQIERERHEDYSIFELDIRPTYDFKQEILKYVEKLEVLKPVWLREEIAGIVQRMLNKYNNKETE